MVKVVDASETLFFRFGSGVVEPAVAPAITVPFAVSLMFSVKVRVWPDATAATGQYQKSAAPWPPPGAAPTTDTRGATATRTSALIALAGPPFVTLAV